MSEKDLEINLGNGKFGNQVMDLSQGDGDVNLIFSGDVQGQLRWKTDGNDIVVTAYGTQEGRWLDAVYKVTYMSKGKYKGKFKVVETIGRYNRIDGEFIGKTTSKTTYTKYPSRFDGQYIPVQVGNDGKIYYYSPGSPMDKYATTIASNEVLGTVRIKGANLLGEDDSLHLISDVYKIYEEQEEDFDNRVDLKNSRYYLIDSVKGKYTGSWTNDMAASSMGNDTYDLKTGNDFIAFTGNTGKDTAILNKDSNLSLFGNEKVFTFKRNGNNLTAIANDYIGKKYDALAKCYVSPNPEKSGEYTGKYFVNTIYYDSGMDGYYYSESYHPNEYKYMTKDELKQYGLAIGDRTNLYIETERNNQGEITTWKSYTKDLSKIYKQTGTMNLKDYFKIGADNVSVVTRVDENGNPISDSIIPLLYKNELNYLGKLNSKKKQTITGTFLNEEIIGGKNNDKIYTGSGYDYVYGSAGNDKIYINGIGDKEFSKGRDHSGTTTIYFDKNLQFVDPETGDKLVNLNLNATSRMIGDGFIPTFCKSGNDLVIDSNAIWELTKREGVRKDLPKPVKDKVIIKDYFNQNELVKNAVTFADGLESKTLEELLVDYPIKGVMQFGKANKKNTIYDTDSTIPDFITGGNKKDTIIVSHTGDDKIITFKGNDTIRFEENATGVKTVQSMIYDGKDTIKIADGLLGLEVDIGSDVLSYHLKNTISYEKTGSDLIYKTTIYKQKNIDFNIKKKVTNTITIKDYFDHEDTYNVRFITEFDEVNTVKSLSDALGDDYLKINGVYNKHYKITNYTGSSLKDEYTYKGKGMAVMIDDGNSDKYNLKLTSKSNLYVNDIYGNDSIIFSNNKNNMRLFFDVELSDNMEIPPTTGNNLYVFNSKSLTSKGVKNARNNNLSGAIEFVDHFKRSGEYSIATFSDSTGDFDMNAWVNKVKGDVVNWLESTNGKYLSTSDVFESGNRTDINALIKVYANDKYNIPV